MIIVNTKPWRRRLAGYLANNDLPRAGTVPKEKGWSVETSKPFGKPGRHVIMRVSNHLEARGIITKEQNDGTLNSHVQEALNPAMTPGEKAVAYALTQVGVHETPWGSNRGADVVRYQTSTGAYGAPWCASFAYYCWRKIGYRGPTSAGAWNATDTIGVRQDFRSMRVGDLVSLDLGLGHVGLFLSHTNTHVRLVAGNTGDAVRIRDYSIQDIHSITRPIV